jgi:hypothetical protein
MVWGSGYPLWLNVGQIQVGFVVYRGQFGVTFDAADISDPTWLAPGQTDYPFWNKEWRRDSLEPLATAGGLRIDNVELIVSSPERVWGIGFALQGDVFLGIFDELDSLGVASDRAGLGGGSAQYWRLSL